MSIDLRFFFKMDSYALGTFEMVRGDNYGSHYFEMRTMASQA